MTLFDEQVARKPDHYPVAREFIDAIWASFWTPNQFTFDTDAADFFTVLNEQERGIIVRNLSAIGQVEIAVKTFWARLGDNFPHPGLNDLGLALGNSEVVHNIAYEKLLNKLKMGDIFEHNLKTVPVMQKRVEYLRKHNKKVYADKRQQYIYSIILFTLFVENVSLFSQFYTTLWFNRYHPRKNLLRDTAQQVQYTRNEEMLHAQVGMWLIDTLRSELPELFDAELEAKITEEIQSAFAAECNMIDWIIGDYNDPKLNAPLLKNFIAERINDSMSAIGFGKPFMTDQGLSDEAYWFTESLLGNNKTDFFWKKPPDYAKHDKAYDAKSILRNRRPAGAQA